MNIDREEALKYMRSGGVPLDAALEARLETVEREVLKAARPAAYWRLEPVAQAAGGRVSVGPLELRSTALGCELADCRRAFLFVATLGAGVDTLVRRLSVTSAADALMAQGLATSLIESYCDDCMAQMAEEAGEPLRRRFSPGYGDLSLDVQRSLLALLDAPRRVGVTLTPDLLMVPTKSVSAVIGVGKEKDE